MKIRLILLLLIPLFSFSQDTLKDHRFSSSLPLSRWTSGTAWLPDSSLPAYYIHTKGKWRFYSQLNIFFRYNRQDVFKAGRRYSDKADIPGFALSRAERALTSKSKITLSAMLSTEPLTVSSAGYPLLFQTGKTSQGIPLTDRQHPHDFLMELSAAYVYSPSTKTDLFVYAAYPGEPALGPPSLLRRPTGIGIPSCALSHHHQDGTHISHGVITSGIRFKKVQIEGSWFNGEPSDEDIWIPDHFKLNSYSYRLSYNRRPNSSLQLSQGYIEGMHLSPSGKPHTGKMIRSTLSILRATAMSSKTFLLSAFVVGINSVNGEHSPSFLFETTYVRKRSSVFNRAELVRRTAQELKIASDEDLYAAQLLVGFQHRLFSISKTDFLLGLQGSVFAGEEPASTTYGEFPVSAEVFLRIHPKQQQPGYEKPQYYNPEINRK